MSTATAWYISWILSDGVRMSHLSTKRFLLTRPFNCSNSRYSKYLYRPGAAKIIRVDPPNGSLVDQHLNFAKLWSK